MRQPALPLGDSRALPATQLIHGDCLEVMPTLPANCVQMIFADLPYGVTAHKWDVTVDAQYFWQCVRGALSPFGLCLLSAIQPFASQLVASNVNNFNYDLIWLKRSVGHFHAKRRPMRSHEHVLVFGPKKSTYNAQLIPLAKAIHDGPSGRHPLRSGMADQGRMLRKTYTHAQPKSAIYFAQDGTGAHPTQKPLALLEWLIRTYTNEGDTVLDPTAGSGTTAVAALRTGRHSICVEKDKGYYDSMCSRVADERARLGAEL